MNENKEQGNALPYYYHEQIWVPFSADVLGWDMDFHQLMLQDRLRMQCYEAAIKQAVRPGMAVLDLGTGSGILARWALEAGAARVYGIEVNPAILARATETMRQAGFGERFHPLCGLSYDIQLPESVDVILSEIIGNLADNEDCIRILQDARHRFLGAAGRMLPAALSSRFVPVCAPHAHQQVAQGRCSSLSEHYNLSELLRHLCLASPFDLYYDVILPKHCYLSAPQTGMRFDFSAPQLPTDYALDLQFTLGRSGQLHGFKGSFVAELTEQIVLDISGDDIANGTSSDSWKHAFLPIRHALAVQAGDVINFHFQRLPKQCGQSSLSCRYAWYGEQLRDGQAIASFTQSMRAQALAACALH